MTDQQKADAFISDLTELTRKHGVCIGGTPPLAMLGGYEDLTAEYFMLEDGNLFFGWESTKPLGAPRACDSNAAMLAALEQALWHWGSDQDRKRILDDGKGWKTDTFAATDLIRAAIATAKGSALQCVLTGITQAEAFLRRSAP